MKIALCLTLGLSAWLLHPTEARPNEGDVTIALPREDDGSIAWITHHNRETLRGEYAIVLHVDGHGDIFGVLHVMPGMEPDRLVIIGLPPGVAVIPSETFVGEGDSALIRVFLAVGF